MKCASWVIVCAGLFLGGVYCLWGPVGEERFLPPAAAEAAEPKAAQPAEKPKALPALKVDRSAPLLLDEPAEKKVATKGKGPKADNHACHVCHTNYQEEWLAVTHADNNVGCVKCHGESIAHRNDENNITPPDTMYPASGIESACVECHETHNVPARKILARFTERRLDTKSPDQIICTDCHGTHRLNNRSVRWDKKTGKLLTGGGAKK